MSDLSGSLTLEEFTKRIYNGKTVYLTGAISGNATQAIFFYPNSIKPRAVSIGPTINVFNTEIVAWNNYVIHDDVLSVDLQKASVSGEACGVYVQLTY